MSDDKTIRRVQQGHQPRKDEVRGYQVSESIDLNNLKIPENLGTAAFTPQNSGQPVSASTEPKKG
jgi:hypothetical protein